MKSLKRLLMLLILVLVVGVICYQIFPEIITNLFFGKAFENSVKYLPLFSVFVAFYVLINFLVMFFLAIDKKKVGFSFISIIVLVNFIIISVNNLDLKIIQNLIFSNYFDITLKYPPFLFVFIILYVLANFIAIFLLGINRKQVGFLLLPMIRVQYLALNFFHDSLWEVINVNIGVSVLILIILSVYFYFTVPKKMENPIETPGSALLP